MIHVLWATWQTYRSDVLCIEDVVEIAQVIVILL